MNKPRVLIVEDEADIRRFVRLALEQEGVEVHEAATAREAGIESSSRKPDLVIVDLGLPDTDGKTFIQELRGWSPAPVVVLSARDQEVEKVAALNAGADDYLVKPFGIPELLARVRAQLRRAALTPLGEVAGSIVRFGPIQVDLVRHEVMREGQPVHLTHIEFRLLGALIRGHGKVLTSNQLLQEVWGIRYAGRTHYVRIYMMNLRQKLEADPAMPQYLLTELQVGYRLTGVEMIPGPGTPTGIAR